MRILFAAGGTGGHLSPALNLANALKKQERDCEVSFLTSGRKIEDDFLTASGFRAAPLFPEEKSRPSLLKPLRWMKAARGARRFIKEFRPHVLIGTGGYVTLVGVLAGLRSGVSVYLLEQNAVPGRATRLAKYFARHIFCHYDEAAAGLGRRASAPGSPLSESIRGEESARPGGSEHALDAREHFGLEPDRPTLLVFGGSLGAFRLNRFVLDNVDALHNDVQILHIAGANDFEEVSSLYAAKGLSARVLPFCHEMDKAYRAADLLLCRAGGMTVAEACASGLPAVMVPYQHKDDHQYKNARLLEKAGAGVIVKEQDAGEETFRRTVGDLISDRQRLKTMGDTSRALGKLEATSAIIGRIEHDLKGRGI